MRISDWSSDVCSSDLRRPARLGPSRRHRCGAVGSSVPGSGATLRSVAPTLQEREPRDPVSGGKENVEHPAREDLAATARQRSEERRVGKECVSPGRSRLSPYTLKKKTHQ